MTPGQLKYWLLYQLLYKRKLVQEVSVLTNDYKPSLLFAVYRPLSIIMTLPQMLQIQENSENHYCAPEFINNRRLFLHLYALASP